MLTPPATHPPSLPPFILWSSQSQHILHTTHLIVYVQLSGLTHTSYQHIHHTTHLVVYGQLSDLTHTQLPAHTPHHPPCSLWSAQRQHIHHTTHLVVYGQLSSNT